MNISRTVRDPRIDKAKQESAIVCLLGKAGREAEKPAGVLIVQSPSSVAVGTHSTLLVGTIRSKCRVL